MGSIADIGSITSQAMPVFVRNFIRSPVGGSGDKNCTLIRSA